jgi:hypothetical protein
MTIRTALAALSGLIMVASVAATAEAGGYSCGYGVRKVYVRRPVVHPVVHEVIVERPAARPASYGVEYHLHDEMSLRTSCYETAIAAGRRLDRLGCHVTIKKDCHAYYVCYHLHDSQEQVFDCRHEAADFAARMENLGFHTDLHRHADAADVVDFDELDRGHDHVGNFRDLDVPPPPGRSREDVGHLVPTLGG